MRTWLVVISVLVACSGGGALDAPKSDGNFDDPDDPGAGGAGETAGKKPDAGPAFVPDVQAAPVLLPGGPNIGLDDVRFSLQRNALLVPAGRTGAIDVVDPTTLVVTPIEGFTKSDAFDGGASEGVTSVDELEGLLAATDRSANRLSIVDIGTRAIVGSANLEATPGYVRAASSNEVWVSEPSLGQVEVFSVADPKAPTRVSAIAVAGVEWLAADRAGGKTYANAGGNTVAIDAATRAVVATWPNGCSKAHAIVLDSAKGVALIACEEGRVVALDVGHGGRVISTGVTGSGLFGIAYDAGRGRVYAPASGTMTVLGMSAGGELTVLGGVAVPMSSRCAVVDGAANVFVCDPERGYLVVSRDPYP